MASQWTVSGQVDHMTICPDKLSVTKKDFSSALANTLILVKKIPKLRAKTKKMKQNILSKSLNFISLVN